MPTFNQIKYHEIRTGQISGRLVLFEKEFAFHKYWINRGIIHWKEAEKVHAASCLRNAFPKLGLVYIKQFLDTYNDINLLEFIKENIE